MSSDFTLKIAGAKNQYSSKLEFLLNNLNLSHKIEFLGLIKGNEKSHLYANAYFTFMPSHTENFGNVIIESLNQGTPCIASKGTPWSSLIDYNAGFWVNNDIKSLTLVIDKIIGLKIDDYQKMRKNSYSFVNKYFDAFNNIVNWENIYKNLYFNFYVN